MKTDQYHIGIGNNAIALDEESAKESTESMTTLSPIITHLYIADWFHHIKKLTLWHISS